MDTLLIVDGMTCPRCTHHVTTALKELGVEEVEVKLRERTVRVRHSAEVGVPELVAALQEVGYPSRAG